MIMMIMISTYLNHQSYLRSLSKINSKFQVDFIYGYTECAFAITA
jgi:hypothetical protein